MPVKDALADRHNFTAEDVVTAFDGWLSARLAEAYIRGKDLCFYDRDFTVIAGRPNTLDGWDYLLLEPGDPPPPGFDWTVYRLHGVGSRVVPIDRRETTRG